MMRAAEPGIKETVMTDVQNEGSAVAAPLTFGIYPGGEAGMKPRIPDNQVLIDP